MLSSVETENEVTKMINKLKLNRSSKYTTLHMSNIQDFPKLHIDDIKNKITLGSYQLNQALSYLAGHLNEDGEHEVFINDHIESIAPYKIILAKIESRHVINCQYNVYIKYLANENSYESIYGWYCNCKDGSRTVRCCSHIACVIYYLSYGKYESNLKKPAEFIVDISPSSRQRLLANNEDLINTVIQDSDEIEEQIDNEENFGFDDVEQYHFDELDINEPNEWNELDTIDSDFNNVEDNSAKDSSFEFLNEISDEYRNVLLEKVKNKKLSKNINKFFKLI